MRTVRCQPGHLNKQKTTLLGNCLPAPLCSSVTTSVTLTVKNNTLKTVISVTLDAAGVRVLSLQGLDFPLTLTQE